MLFPPEEHAELLPTIRKPQVVAPSSTRFWDDSSIKVQYRFFVLLNNVLEGDAPSKWEIASFLI